MKRYGYHRTSTREQHLDRGIKEITAYCEQNNLELEKIFTDQQTGKNFNRPRYQVLKEDVLRAGVGKDVDIPQGIGIIIEHPGFLRDYSGFQNLKLLARLQKKITDEKIKESIRLVGLDPEDKKKVGKFSLGMRQRLGIAQAIMESPDILILDEPMNGLDKHGVEDMRKLLVQLKEEGTTILVASHNPLDIEILCDEVYEMDAGAITKVH